MSRSSPTLLCRTAVAALALTLAACTTRAPRTAPASTGGERDVAFVTEITTTVADLEAATRLFVGTLGAEVVDTHEVSGPELSALLGVEAAQVKIRRLHIGGERVSLMQFLAPAAAPARTGAVSNDLDFQHMALVVSDMDRMYTQVVAAVGVTAVSVDGPQRIPDSNVAAAGIRAFYFRDIDQRPLELIWYPRGKGASRWHARGGALLLGVDHSAIGVASTDRSRAFYQGLLGLSVRGQSLNEGPEQADLSGVAGARVRITGLGGPAGPGIELLEYEAPGLGARLAARTPASVGYWEISVHMPDLDATWRALASAGAVAVSDRVALCQTCSVGQRAFVVYDPDGHAVRVAGE